MVGNIHLRLWCDAQLAVFSNSFMWLTAVLPYLVVAERYFAGEIEFGVISQVCCSEGDTKTMRSTSGGYSRKTAHLLCVLCCFFLDLTFSKVTPGRSYLSKFVMIWPQLS